MLLDPLLHDCPDYASLVPPATTVPKKRFKFRDDDDEVSDEIRMCVSCRKLVGRYVLKSNSPNKLMICIIVYRRLSHLGTLEKNELEVLYDKLRATMIDSEDRKPTFIDVAKAIWYNAMLMRFVWSCGLIQDW